MKQLQANVFEMGSRATMLLCVTSHDSIEYKFCLNNKHWNIVIIVSWKSRMVNSTEHILSTDQTLYCAETSTRILRPLMAPLRTSPKSAIYLRRSTMTTLFLKLTKPNWQEWAKRARGWIFCTRIQSQSHTLEGRRAKHSWVQISHRE